MKRDGKIEYQILMALERAISYHVYCPHLRLVATDGTPVPYETIRGHLHLLVDEGVVAETKSNHWRLTAAGHTALGRLRQDDTMEPDLVKEH